MSDLMKLPRWNEPSKLSEARSAILSLGRSMHEHAYLVGKHLIWVKAKVGHGKFLPWIEENLWFSEATAQRMIGFAWRCDEEKTLLSYEPDKSRMLRDFKDAPSLPAGKYRVLYADPPWSYSNTGFDQSAASQYPTMATDEIAALPVVDLTADDAALFLWVTSPLLPDGIRVLAAWGFAYKASIIWQKDRAPGLGWWVHTKHELLLIGSRGEIGTPREKPDSLFCHPVGKHSEKPEIVRSMIELMFPGPYIELFARKAVSGWVSWGNEIRDEASLNQETR